MNIDKEQLKFIAQAIDIDEVKKMIQDNLSEYNKFVIEETKVKEDKKKYPRKDDINGCGNLCTI